jgi:hypothetical protein
MHVFGPLIDASQENLDSELLRHRELVAEVYGEDASRAYADVDPLDAPLVVSTSNAQRAAMLARPPARPRRTRARNAGPGRAGEEEDRHRQLGEGEQERQQSDEAFGGAELPHRRSCSVAVGELGDPRRREDGGEDQRGARPSVPTTVSIVWSSS